MKRYTLCNNVNNTGNTAIVDILSKEIVCWCDIINGALIEKALNAEENLLKTFLTWFSTQNIIISETSIGMQFRKSNIGSSYVSLDNIIDLFHSDKTQ